MFDSIATVLVLTYCLEQQSIGLIMMHGIVLLHHNAVERMRLYCVCVQGCNDVQISPKRQGVIIFSLMDAPIDTPYVGI